VISGFLGLGVLRDNAFTEFTGYVRPQFRLPVGQPSIGRTGWITGPTGPVHAAISHGALFDLPDGPRALVCWQWLPAFTTIPQSGEARYPQFAPVEVSVCWTNATLHSLYTSMEADAPEPATIERGVQIGTINGQGIFALQRLVAVGGNLVAKAALVRPRAA
jgi:hypothetical protein